MPDPAAIVRIFTGSGDDAEKLARIAHLAEMESAFWQAATNEVQDLLHDIAQRAVALDQPPFAEWEAEERSAIALLLLYALRWYAARSDTHRENAKLDAVEACGRMRARKLFRGSLSKVDRALLKICEGVFETRLLPKPSADSRSRRERAPRSAGELALPTSYVTQLFRLREALRFEAPPRLVLEEVAAAEKALRVTLPDRLLGLIAVLGTPPRPLVELTRELRQEEGFDRSWVAIGPETWERCARAMPVCALCGDDGGADLVFAWDAESEATCEYRAGADDGGSDFATFLTWRWGRYQRLPNAKPPTDFETPNADLDAPVSAEILAAFRPALVPEAAGRRRVSHPKFGEGEVLSELDGKCTVAFASGTKTLLSSVLKPA